ncbi:hypothetical protein MmiHf6_01980 [Methanimicrococcus hongohii]|uniref:Uncharacterized protein n=1 Tax=Methanimicrococcus hongohii TaxID=3028295 RepID=A0AA96V7F1_9EURY|nr:hypothetical protein [Methanimicrococcus sp. Hf6]WNY22906.1 hypothetical protein MmiHf6_01980 [Methanimicrococcus sp. Hf6]
MTNTKAKNRLFSRLPIFLGIVLVLLVLGLGTAAASNEFDITNGNITIVKVQDEDKLNIGYNDGEHDIIAYVSISEIITITQSNSEKTSFIIVVDTTGFSNPPEIQIKLDGVNISNSTSSAMSLKGGASFRVILSGDNFLTGGVLNGAGQAGLEVSPDSKLTISGDGSLTVKGGDGSSYGNCYGGGGAGIGTHGGASEGVIGHPSENVGIITIKGGIVTATGGKGAWSGNGAGIGSGSGGVYNGSSPNAVGDSGDVTQITIDGSKTDIIVTSGGIGPGLPGTNPISNGKSGSGNVIITSGNVLILSQPNNNVEFKNADGDPIYPISFFVNKGGKGEAGVKVTAGSYMAYTRENSSFLGGEVGTVTMWLPLNDKTEFEYEKESYDTISRNYAVTDNNPLFKVNLLNSEFKFETESPIYLRNGSSDYEVKTSISSKIEILTDSDGSGLTIDNNNVLDATNTMTGKYDIELKATSDDSNDDYDYFIEKIFTVYVWDFETDEPATGTVNSEYNDKIEIDVGSGEHIDCEFVLSDSTSHVLTDIGLTLNPDGTITGTPTGSGSFSIIVEATTSGCYLGSKEFDLIIQDEVKTSGSKGGSGFGSATVTQSNTSGTTTQSNETVSNTTATGNSTLTDNTNEPENNQNESDSNQSANENGYSDDNSSSSLLVFGIAAAVIAVLAVAGVYFYKKN